LTPELELGTTDWEAELSATLGYAVKVEFTRARSCPIQLRHAKREELRANPALRKGWVVRLHSIFREAPPEIRADLASWIRVGGRARRASRELGSWTELALRALPARSPRQISQQTSGDIHDLSRLTLELLESELCGEFGEHLKAPKLTWGKRGKSQARKSIQLGSFHPGQHLIRIHPVLDQAKVPGWFVRYVLFHEHLHAVLPSERSGESQRTLHHGPRFLAREKSYVDYERAVKWETKNLGKLLRSARKGTAR
jgi:hypothetical protein